MSIQRRNFVRSLLAVPAVPIGLAAQQAAQKATPSATPQQPVPQPNTPARQVPRQPQEIPVLKTTPLDLTAETEAHFFTAAQFATLEKLAEVLMPPMNGNPGAVDAHAPEFIDFLIGASPRDRQKLYREGLDTLQAHSEQKFHKPFAELDATQVGSILRPLLVVRLWPEDLPKDPTESFVAQVHEDIRTATFNSREWAAVAAKSTHRFSRGRGTGTYWKPVDPIGQG